jgi:glycosyltransferase involved in cell wall biosynthesis
MYILVTRVRDEAKYLPGLFQSVFAQTVKPSLWVIVNHDSKDESPAVIAEAIKNTNWIIATNLPALEQYGLLCHARPLKVGFEVAVQQAEQMTIDYRYLGILDADIVPEPEYFEKLIRDMEESPGLGIVSGRLFIPNGDGEKPEDNGKIPRGGCRIYRRECYESIGGSMPESALWDTETDILAESRGWQVTTFPTAKALHKRVTYSRKGKFKGYWRLGKVAYYAHTHPIAVFMNMVYFTPQPPFIDGLVYFISYINSWLRKEKQTDNQEIRDYYWKSVSRILNKALVGMKNLFR